MRISQDDDSRQIGRIWKNATWLGVIPILLNFVAVLSSGYIARRVGVVGFGRFSIGLATVGLAQTFTDLGLRALAVRDLSRTGPGSHRALIDLLSLRLLMSSIATVLSWGIAASMSASSGLRPVIMISSLTIIPTALAGILTDGLIARDEARTTSAATFWSGVLLTLASVMVVAVWPTAAALAASYLVGPIVNMAMLHRRARQLYGAVRLRWRPRQWTALTRRALPFFRVGILGVAVGRMETPIIGWLFGTGMAGVYSAAILLADRLGATIDSVNTAALPTLMRLRGDATRITDVLARIMHPLLGVILAGTIMAVMGTTAAVTVVFGADYAPGGPALAVALLLLPLAAINGLTNEGFIALRRVKFVTSTTLRGQALAAVLMPLLPMVVGLPGVPLARLLGSISIAIQRVPAIRQVLPGLWGRQHVRPIAVRCLWALPIPVILFVGHFRPIVAVLIAGGAFLGWLAATAHTTGALQMLHAAMVAGSIEGGVVDAELVPPTPPS